MFLRETSSPTLELSDVTFADAGIYHVEVGNYAGFTVSATASLTVAADGYDLWMRQRFSEQEQNNAAISGATADPDGDGLPNLLAYGLGHDPLPPRSVHTGQLTASVSTSNTVALVFERVDDPALLYAVESSSDLKTWSTLWTSFGAQNTDGPIMIEGPDAGETPLFFRLRITR